MRRKNSLFLPVLLLLALLLSSGSVILYAQDDTESSSTGTSDGEAPTEELYHENQWNFVEDSMDISSGIPENAVGRLARIRERGKLTVATEPYFAPQEFIDPDYTGQDQYVGSDMKLARLIADHMGVELEIVPLEFTDVLSSMAAGTYDLAISGLSYTPGRASSMELSKGYHYSSEGASVGLIIREEDRDSLTQLTDLFGRNLTAQAGSLQELLVAQNIPNYRKFVRPGSTQEVYDPDCGLVLMEGVEFELEEQFQGDRIAGPKDDLELMYFVNGVIDEVLASGEYEEWFDEAASRAAELGL